MTEIGVYRSRGFAVLPERPLGNKSSSLLCSVNSLASLRLSSSLLLLLLLLLLVVVVVVLILLL